MVSTRHYSVRHICIKYTVVSQVAPLPTTSAVMKEAVYFQTHLTWKVREEEMFPLLRSNGLELEVFNVGSQEWFINICGGKFKQNSPTDHSRQSINQSTI